jgi:hypothetical protein
MEDAMTVVRLSPQTEIAETIIHWDAPKLLQNPALIEITGMALADSSMYLAERILTIRMDVQAAVRISKQILDLVRM